MLRRINTNLKFMSTMTSVSSNSNNVGKRKYRFIDIGANLTDPMYQGTYFEKVKHEPDLDLVLKRAWDAGVERIIVTAGCLEDSKKALKLAMKDPRLYCTVGVHPTRGLELEDGGDEILDELLKIATEGQKVGKCVAIGECGLDYDRTKFCPIDVQRKAFEMQFSLAEKTGLPMFLHCRNAGEDMAEILSKHRKRFVAGGVVHSFDGSIEEANAICELNLYIGINGCSLRKEENLKVAAAIPNKHLMLETDAPWCEIKKSHAGFGHVKSLDFQAKKKEKFETGLHVKGRNEPCRIVQVLEVLGGAKGYATSSDLENFATTLYENTCRLFFPGDGDFVGDIGEKEKTNAVVECSESSNSIPLGHTKFSWQGPLE